MSKIDVLKQKFNKLTEKLKSKKSQKKTSNAKESNAKNLMQRNQASKILISKSSFLNLILKRKTLLKMRI